MFDIIEEATKIADAPHITVTIEGGRVHFEVQGTSSELTNMLSAVVFNNAIEISRESGVPKENALEFLLARLINASLTRLEAEG